jgi:hypothetical protein
MATILPTGQKMAHIQLIVNWFESHRILSPILTAAAEYKLASKCRYLDSSIVVGPKQLADRYAVDEITIARSRQRTFVNSVKVAAQLVSIDDPKGFDFKMAILREIMPQQVTAILRLTEQLIANWRVAIAFESKLDETAPMLHQLLEEDRGRILTRVVELMFASNEPWKRLGEAEDIANGILRQSFGKQYESLISNVSSGEIARLIGECPIGWEAPTIRNA